MRHCLAVLIILCATASAPTTYEVAAYSLRELTYRADLVILAKPLDSAATGRFEVLHVLRGKGVKSGDTFSLSAEDRSQFLATKFGKLEDVKPDDSPQPFAEALLFLTAATGDQPARLLPFGLLLGTSEGDVWKGRQFSTSGPYVMTTQEGILWPVVVKEAKAAAATIDEVLQLKQNAGRERAADLLKWIGRHRLEFGGGFFDGERSGWGSLETDVFDWVCECGRPEECWAAAKLYAELNHNAALPVRRPCFGTPAGRAFLLKVAQSDKAFDGDRARALVLLTNKQTLHPALDKDRPNVGPMRDEDVVALVKTLTPLPEAKSDALRSAALQAIRAIVQWRGADPKVSRELKEALPSLAKTYKAEKPGAIRDLLVETIYGIGGPAYWKQVSGSGHAVLLSDFGLTKSQITFWLKVLPDTDKIYQCPTLVLERLDSQGKVLETKTKPLPVVNAPRWQEGWTPNELLAVQFSTESLIGQGRNPEVARPQRRPPSRQPSTESTTNTWRVSVRGTVGKDSVQWSSEPKLFVSPMVRNPNESYQRPWGEKAEK